MPLATAIAGSSAGAYFAPMLAALLRLLTVAALALMPLGMATASASPTRHAPAAAGQGHCDDQGGQPSDESRDPLAGCAGGCSMFLAAQDRADELVAALALLTVASPAQRWVSLPPETATPPPKRA